MSRSGGSRYSWVDDAEGRQALSAAWAWCVGAGLVPPSRTAALVLADAEEERTGQQAETGQRRGQLVEYARAWEILTRPAVTLRDWRDFAAAAGPGVRGIARARLDDASEWGLHQPPSYRQYGAIRRAGSEWEVCVGWAGTTQQCGTWPTREAALAVAQYLRPPPATVEDR